MTAGALDETYIRVKGKWRYLYAVDSNGATLDFLLYKGIGVTDD